MRLIDADAFLERMSRTDRFFGVVYDINDAPTVDAVPVVRCKDCKYRTKDTRWTRAGFCGRRGAGDCFAAPPEGYCSYGERAENNGVDQRKG